MIARSSRFYGTSAICMVRSAWLIGLCSTVASCAGLPPVNPVVKSQGVHVSKLREKFVPNANWIVTFNLSNLNSTAKRVQLRAGMQFTPPSLTKNTVAKNVTVGLQPNERRPMSVEIWAPQWADEFVSGRLAHHAPTVQVVSVADVQTPKQPVVGSVQFRTIAIGRYSGYREKATEVIDIRKQDMEPEWLDPEKVWRRTWALISSVSQTERELPEINFEQEMVIVAFLGKQSSEEFGIRVRKISRSLGELHVEVERVPTLGENETSMPETVHLQRLKGRQQALISPYHVVQLQFTDLPIRAEVVRDGERYVLPLTE